jgi:hypothetical protein
VIAVRKDVLRGLDRPNDPRPAACQSRAAGLGLFRVPEGGSGGGPSRVSASRGVLRTFQRTPSKTENRAGRLKPMSWTTVARNKCCLAWNALTKSVPVQ